MGLLAAACCTLIGACSSERQYPGRTAQGNPFDDDFEDLPQPKDGSVDEIRTQLDADLPETFALRVTFMGDGDGRIDSDDGSLSCTADSAECFAVYAEGTSVTLRATPTPPARFMAWLGDGLDCASADVCTLELAKDTELTAAFVIEEVPLQVGTEGGGAGRVESIPAAIDCGDVCAATFVHGSTVMLLAEPDLDTSVFAGWGGACSGESSECEVLLEDMQEVRARFELLRRELEVEKLGDGSGAVRSLEQEIIDCGEVCEGEVPRGAVVALEATADAGSTFAGWEGCESETSVCEVSMTQDRIVSARFTQNRYALTVDRAGEGSGRISSDAGGIDCGEACIGTYVEGETIVLTAIADEVSIFTGWSGACAGTASTCQISMTDARSVTATFGLLQRRLTVSTSGSGAGTVTSTGISCPGDCTQDFDHGTSVTLTAAAGANSAFTGWSGACTGTAPTCQISMTDARNVTAMFGLVQRTLTVSTNGAGAGTVTGPRISCPGDCIDAYAHGTIVTLTANPAPGSIFSGWSGGACSGTATTCNVTMTMARSVTATFTLPPTLTVSTIGTGSGRVAGPGIECPGDCTQAYPPGTLVTLTAVPGSSAVFTGWLGACSGTSSTCQVAMTAARNVTATFAPQERLLTVFIGSSGGITGQVLGNGIWCPEDCTNVYPDGTQVILTASSGGTNAVFLGWSGACTGISRVCVLTMTAQRNVTAMFAPAALTRTTTAP